MRRLDGKPVNYPELSEKEKGRRREHLSRVRSDNRGEKNPMYKGDEAGYAARHDWVRSRKAKPELCECCGLVPPLDLANISGEYKRDLDDWEYLCRRCHMMNDGRIEAIRKRQKKRKELNKKPCLLCGKQHYNTKFCSRDCVIKARRAGLFNSNGVPGVFN